MTNFPGPVPEMYQSPVWCSRIMIRILQKCLLNASACAVCKAEVVEI